MYYALLVDSAAFFSSAPSSLRKKPNLTCCVFHSYLSLAILQIRATSSSSGPTGVATNTTLTPWNPRRASRTAVALHVHRIQFCLEIASSPVCVSKARLSRPILLLLSPVIFQLKESSSPAWGAEPLSLLRSCTGRDISPFLTILSKSSKLSSGGLGR